MRFEFPIKKTVRSGFAFIVSVVSLFTQTPFLFLLHIMSSSSNPIVAAFYDVHKFNTSWHVVSCEHPTDRRSIDELTPMEIWEVCHDNGDLRCQEQPIEFAATLGTKEEKFFFYNNFNDILKTYCFDRYPSFAHLLREIFYNIDHGLPLISSPSVTAAGSLPHGY
jgi:hypothetical protein